MMLAAYQPDIPQNVGALMRIAAGFDLPLGLIEPFGFPWNERKIRQAAMDYYDAADIRRYRSWSAFLENRGQARIVLMTTRAAEIYSDFQFEADDIILLGRESAGVPDTVHNAADARIIIPMSAKIRSFNIAVSAAIVVAEARRQLKI